MEQQQGIGSRGDKLYYTRVPNMWLDDLSMHEGWLLVHYARVAGEDGACWESVRTTAKKCGMGLAKLIETRNELCNKGYLYIYEGDESDYDATLYIEVRNAWTANQLRYSRGEETHSTSGIKEEPNEEDEVKRGSAEFAAQTPAGTASDTPRRDRNSLKRQAEDDDGPPPPEGEGAKPQGRESLTPLGQKILDLARLGKKKGAAQSLTARQSELLADVVPFFIWSLPQRRL